MADELEKSAAGAIDKLVNAADALIAKLGILAEKYGPEVVDAGLTVVQLNGVNNLLGAGLVAIGAAIVGPRSLRLFVTGRQLERKWLHPDTPSSAPSGMWQTFVGGIGTAGGIIGAVYSVSVILNIWNWVAIFAPKLWIAHKLLGL